MQSSLAKKMTKQVRDPVSRTRYSFERQGEDLVVYTWLQSCLYP